MENEVARNALQLLFLQKHLQEFLCALSFDRELREYFLYRGHREAGTGKRVFNLIARALLFWQQLRIALRESASTPAGYTVPPGQPPQLSRTGEPARPAGQHRE